MAREDHARSHLLFSLSLSLSLGVHESSFATDDALLVVTGLGLTWCMQTER